MTKEILVIGSINNDLAFSVDHFPHPGETLISQSMHQSNGGKGANQAVALARLGSKVTMISRIGNDPIGAKIKEDLGREGIDTQYITSSDTNTGTAIINVDAKGENTIILDPGANNKFSKDEIRKLEEAISNFDSCLLQFEIPLPIIYEIIDICNKHQVSIVLNPAPYLKEFDKSYLDKVDYYIPNELEFASTLGIESFSSKHDFERHGLAFANDYGLSLIVTLGSKGSVLFSDNDIIYVEAIKSNVIDTTAAGDTYIGALVSAFTQGSKLVDAMHYASKASSFCIGKKGAQSSIPYQNDLSTY